MTPRILLAIAPFLLANLAFAQNVPQAELENWPRWRGPLSNGTAPLGNPPLEWSESKNVKWKIDVPGRGSATPIIWNDQIFILTAIPTDRKGPERPQADPPADPPADGAPRGPRGGRGSGRGGRGGFGPSEPPTNYHQFVVISYDRETGKERWRRVATETVPHEGGHATNTFASGSPTTDGKHLFVTFGSEGLYCYDLEGNEIWKRDLGDMQTRMGFGEGTSPSVSGDTLVMTWDHEAGSFIAALDAASGEDRWRQDRDEPTSWATPLIVEYGGRKQVITNGTNRVRSYDLDSGELLWECGGQGPNAIPSPVPLGDLAICMTGFRTFAVYAIPLTSQGDITDTDKVAWKRNDAGPYIASPVLYDGTLYFTKDRTAILYSVDAVTGEQKINEQRLNNLKTLYSSPVAANGRIYITDRDGTTLVIKHAPELEVLAKNKLDDGIDASAAIVGNQMFLRGSGHLYCIQEE